MKFRVRYLFLAMVLASVWMILQINYAPGPTKHLWAAYFGLPILLVGIGKIASPILAILFFRQGKRDFQDANIRESTLAFLCGILSAIAFLVSWFGLPQSPTIE